MKGVKSGHGRKGKTMSQVHRKGCVNLWLSLTGIPKYRALDAVEIYEIIKLV
jgi:hypothetical protein